MATEDGFPGFNLSKIKTHMSSDDDSAHSLPMKPSTPVKGGNATPRTPRSPLTPMTEEERQNLLQQVCVCTDDTAPSVKAQTLEELHSLQKKRSAPTTPRRTGTPRSPFGNSTPRSPFSQDRERQLMDSISASLASVTREHGPQIVICGENIPEQ